MHTWFICEHLNICTTNIIDLIYFLHIEPSLLQLPEAHTNVVKLLHLISQFKTMRDTSA